MHFFSKKTKDTRTKKLHHIILPTLFLLLSVQSVLSACIVESPRIVADQSFRFTKAGDSITYIATITNRDSADCGPSNFEVQVIDTPLDSNYDPSDIDGIGSGPIPVFSLAGGASKTVTVTINPKPTAIDWAAQNTGIRLHALNPAHDYGGGGLWDDVVITKINNSNSLIHNSANTNSTKWGGIYGGIWGTSESNAKYGEFTCNTCHGKNTGNIKRVNNYIEPPADLIPGNSETIVFTDTRDGSSDFAETDGAHATSNKICEICHTYDQYGNNGVNYHAYDMSGVDTGLNPGQQTHYLGSDCIKCHPHNQAFKPSCGGCHGNPPVVDAPQAGDGLVLPPGNTGSVTSGAHGRHKLVVTNFKCETCHYNGTPALHDDGSVTIGFVKIPTDRAGFGNESRGDYDGQSGVSYNSGHANTSVSAVGTKQCSNIYCHGYTIGGGNNMNPAWDGTVVCGDCHKATAAAMATGALGSHQRHAGNAVGQLNVTCTECHGSNFLIPDSMHGGGNVRWYLLEGSLTARSPNAKYTSADLSIDGPSGGTSQLAPSAAYGTCSNFYCHSNVQTANGTAAADTFSTPTWGAVSVACDSCHGQAAQGDGEPATGSHAKHSGNGSAKNYACSACHDGAGDETALHADETIDIDINAAYDGAQAPASYTKGSPAPGSGVYGVCDNTYCHGDYPGSGGENALNGLNSTPTWGTPASGACNTCHGATQDRAPDYPNSGSHSDHTQFRDYDLPCTFCHNGIVGGTGPASFSVVDQGKHANHKVDWAFDQSDPRILPTSSYSIPSGTLSPSDGSVRAYGNCSNIYCHSIGQTSTGGALTSGNTTEYLSPTWGGGNRSIYSCGSCHAVGAGVHEATPGDDAGEPMISSGSHTAHNQYGFRFTAANKGVRCAMCHKSGPNALDTDPAALNCLGCHNSYPNRVAGNIIHADGKVDIIFDPDFVEAATYNGTPAVGDGFGSSSCDNTYCHSDGTAVSTASVTTNSTPAWGSAGPLACSSCHGGTVTGPAYPSSTPKTNSHSAHTPTYGCVECHASTVNAGNTIISTIEHVDKSYDVSGPQIGSYSFALTGGNCTSTYCHSDGKGNYTNPTWGNNSTGCDFCHGYPPATAHPANNDCSLCHSHVAANDISFTDSSLHINAAINVSDNCIDCHATLPDGHDAHSNQSWVLGSGTLSGGDYGTLPNWYATRYVSGKLEVGCGLCHPETSINHINGVVNVDVSKTANGSLRDQNAAGAGYAGQACSQVYCHSDGDNKGGGVYGWNDSPDWKTGTVSGACNDCHGNNPTTNAHEVHQIGIHPGDTFTGSNGLMVVPNSGTTLPTQVDHGTATLTTLNCNICHNSTVTVAYNDAGSACASCHVSGPVNNMMVDAGSTTHINGQPDIQFADIQLKIKSQLRGDIATVAEINSYWSRNSYKAGEGSSVDTSKTTLATTANWDGTTCTTVSCHNGNPVNWGTVTGNCALCHTQLPQ